jgi:uncharacterized protein (TIGR03067 family)
MTHSSRADTTRTWSPTDLKVTPHHLEDCWDEPEPVAPQDHQALEALQGAWEFVSGRRRAELLISGTHLAIHFADGDIYLGSFTLEPASRPGLMIIHIDEGPPRHKGGTAHCIYEVVGDTLRWCTAWPGPANRLSAFPDESDPRYLCLAFRREHLNGLV